MAAPVFVSKGSVVASRSATITFPIPSTASEKDLLLLICQSSNEAISTPSGWNEIGNQTLQSRATPDPTRLGVFYKFASQSDAGSSITIPANTDHTMGQILVFRGVDRLGFASTENYSSSSGITTTVGTVQNMLSVNSTIKPKRTDCLILTIAAISRDFNSTDNFSTVAVNPNLSSFTELTDQTVNDAAGGGIVAWSALNKNMNTVGFTTAIYDGSGIAQTYGTLVLSLRPMRNLTSFS